MTPATVALVAKSAEPISTAPTGLAPQHAPVDNKFVVVFVSTPTPASTTVVLATKSVPQAQAVKTEPVFVILA